MPGIDLFSRNAITSLMLGIS